MKLAVNEIFGPTFQGEGASLGMPCFFFRLSGCNLECVWCDTAYTWDWKGKNGIVYDPKKEIHPMTVDEVYQKLAAMAREHNLKNLVVSGGEPLLQTVALTELVDLLKQDGWWVEVETAGTLIPGPRLAMDRYTVSLKLENSGNSMTKRRRPKSIAWFVKNKKSNFKFVVASETDFNEVRVICHEYGIEPKRVYIMPEGIDKDSIQLHSLDAVNTAIRCGYNITTRLHILLNGNTRAI
jgi:7-carboxy-7-deazaguanine synthase